MSERKRTAVLDASFYRDPVVVHSFNGMLNKFKKLPSLLESLKIQLTEQALAMLTYNFRDTMETYCGRNSPNPKPITKIPSRIFEDSGPDSTLAAILQWILEYASKNGIPLHEVFNQNRDSMCSIFVSVEHTLKCSNLLTRPKVSFNKVPVEMLNKLSKIVLDHGGIVVNTVDAASHVIDWNEEVDNYPEVFTDDYIRILEIRSNIDNTSSATNSNAITGVSATSAIRTSDTAMDIVNIAPEQVDSVNETGNAQTGTNNNTSNNSLAEQGVSSPSTDNVASSTVPLQLARVHWWYYPDSYDEWIPASEISANEPPELTSLYPTSRTTWYVCCRYILDCETFNEWGNEVDYEPENNSSNGGNNSNALYNNSSADSNDVVNEISNTAIGNKKSRGKQKKIRGNHSTGAATTTTDTTTINSGNKGSTNNPFPIKELPITGTTLVVGAEKLLSDAAPQSILNDDCGKNIPVLDMKGAGSSNITTATPLTTGTAVTMVGGGENAFKTNCKLVVISSSSTTRSNPPNNNDNISSTQNVVPTPTTATTSRTATNSSQLLGKRKASTENSSSNSNGNTENSFPEWFSFDTVSFFELQCLGKSICGTVVEAGLNAPAEIATSITGLSEGDNINTISAEVMEVVSHTTTTTTTTADTAAATATTTTAAAADANDIVMTVTTNTITDDDASGTKNDNAVAAANDADAAVAIDPVAAEYMKIRNSIISLCQLSPLQYITGTECRRKLAGDVCKIIKIHEFLNAFGMINRTARHDARTAPTLLPVLPILSSGSLIPPPSRVNNYSNSNTIKWNSEADALLIECVKQQQQQSPVLDWSVIATKMNANATNSYKQMKPSSKSISASTASTFNAAQCAARFVAMRFDHLPDKEDRNNNINGCRFKQEMHSDDTSKDTATAAAAAVPPITSLTGLQSLLSSLRCLKQKCNGSSDLQSAADNIVQEAVSSLRQHREHRQQQQQMFSTMYLQTKLKILEEKVALLSNVEGMLNAERLRQKMERNDLQILRAQLAVSAQLLLKDSNATQYHYSGTANDHPSNFI